LRIILDAEFCVKFDSTICILNLVSLKCFPPPYFRILFRRSLTRRRACCFWPVIAGIFSEPPPATLAEKRALLARRHLALWDVAARAEVRGAEDSALRRVEPNDLRPLMAQTAIRAVVCDGG
jgi:hypothetical protein